MKTEDGWHDLGEELPSPEEMMQGMEDDGPKVVYPRFTVRGEGDAPEGKEGEFMVKLRKVREVETEDEDGETRHECEYEVLAMKPMKTRKSDATEDVVRNMDKAARRAMEKDEEEGY